MTSLWVLRHGGGFGLVVDLQRKADRLRSSSLYGILTLTINDHNPFIRVLFTFIHQPASKSLCVHLSTSLTWNEVLPIPPGGKFLGKAFSLPSLYLLWSGKNPSRFKNSPNWDIHSEPETITNEKKRCYKGASKELLKEEGCSERAC